MLAGTIESGLMGSDLESAVRKSSWPNIVLGVDQNIEDPAAFFTNEMLVALDQRVEMLRASQHENLELFIRDQFLQVAIDGSEAHVGQTLADFVVDLIRRWMRIIIFDRVPNTLQLFGVSWFFVYFGHNYAVRSSIKDCRVPGSMSALAL